jgi:16S rRNA (uracil1498-N3)-methyltransferase
VRVSRIFLPGPLQADSLLELPEEAAHYVKTVLRLKKGQLLCLFNGMGVEAEARLLEVSRKHVQLEITQIYQRLIESKLNIHLALGISRGDRMDWSIQKAVELGVRQITPLLTERTVVKIHQGRDEQKWQHWFKIIQHAAEQCHRTDLPELNAVQTLSDWLKTVDGVRLLLDPDGQQTLAAQMPQDNRLVFLIGPEGGLSAVEKQDAVSTGFSAIRMGPRILRTETAVITSLSAAQALWGDFA